MYLRQPSHTQFDLRDSLGTTIATLLDTTRCIYRTLNETLEIPLEMSLDLLHPAHSNDMTKDTAPSTCWGRLLRYQLRYHSQCTSNTTMLFYQWKRPDAAHIICQHTEHTMMTHTYWWHTCTDDINAMRTHMHWYTCVLMTHMHWWHTSIDGTNVFMTHTRWWHPYDIEKRTVIVTYIQRLTYTDKSHDLTKIIDWWRKHIDDDDAQGNLGLTQPQGAWSQSGTSCTPCMQTSHITKSCSTARFVKFWECVAFVPCLDKFEYMRIFQCICRSAFVTQFTTLQHTATHCSTLQHTAAHCSTLQHTATHCNTLQHTATHCSTLQHTATAAMRRRACAAHCNALQNSATRCNTMQHTALAATCCGRVF